MRALVLDKSDAGFSASVRELTIEMLPPGDVMVQMEYSTLNYKDALAITNTGPVVRHWPMVAGIDGAGVVVESRHPGFAPGDRVVHNGWGLGETRWGCLAEQMRLQGDQLVALPAGRDSRWAMQLGTAGYTAMLCVMALERHGVRPGDGEVLVTGASGGVGSVAVTLLAKAGYTVVASTGKLPEEAYLRQLGASEVVDRAALAAPGKPLQRERWAAVVDTLGSHSLANALAQTRYGGAVAACGLAQGGDLPSTVMPFILRGVALLGVDSVMAPMAMRHAAWERLARDIGPDILESVCTEIDLDGVIDAAARLKAGTVRGRWLVRLGSATPVPRAVEARS